MPIMKDFIALSKDKGIRCSVLSVEMKGDAETAKRTFLKEKYPEFSDNEIIIVRSVEDKIRIMQKVCKSLACEPIQVGIIEDNFYTILEAASLGFLAIPISYFLIS